MAGWALNLAAFLTGLAGMELVAWATHRYLMHGPLWRWHRSHHSPRRGLLEANDVFGLGFAGLAVLLFIAAAQLSQPLLAWLAWGMTAYGLLYALVHDGLVHRRFPFPLQGRSGYLQRLVRAHHLHHARHERDGAVSFGFLWAQDPLRLAEELKRRNKK